MIKVESVSFSYGADPIFDRVNFLVAKNKKVGLVGPNGAGKSTLFKLLMGNESQSAGSIKIIGDISYVPQEVKRDSILEKSKSIRDYIDPGSLRDDFEIVKLFSGLELANIDLDSHPAKLSGGQKTKLALARALMAEPDILLLDEPTNFMDVKGKRFVMNFLASYPKTLIVISHDLKLLDSHIDKVLELDKHSHKIIEYKGNYSEYVRLKKERDAHLARQVMVKQKKIKRMEKSLRTKLIKQKSKKGVRQRVVFQRRLEREKANLPPMPPEIKKMKLNLPDPPRVAELPIKVVDISKSFENNKIIKNLNISIRRDEKFVILGANGAGKSTVIKIMMKLLKPDSGHVVEGENLRIGYYSQEFDVIDLNKTLLEVVEETGNIGEQKARSVLARFMFDSMKVKQKVESLSGGEKTRLSIALLVLAKNNLLILDEPTTYLDPMSQRVILEALKQYKGTMILVSHVEDFIKEIRPDRALIMPDANIKLWSNELLDLVSEI